MALATLFPISVYLLLAFASGILMYSEASGLTTNAEQAVFPSILTIPLSFVAYHLSERRSKIVLSGWRANVLGLIALIAAAYEFRSDDLEGRLLSGTHLLVYLAWIVMFLQKNREHYWWMIALGLLQVAVSSVLTRDVTYGFLLIVFTLLTIWTVSLFTVFQAYQDEAEMGGKEHASGLSQRLSPRLVRAGHGISLFGTSSRSIGGIEYDSNAKWIGLRFGGRTLIIAGGCLFVGSLFFFFTPRLWSNINPFTDETLAGRTVTGYSDQVKLGQMGEILESNQPVLSVKIFKPNNEQISVENFIAEYGFDEPYFRGGVMSTYDRGEWSAARRRDDALRLDQIQIASQSYRQEYELEPIGTQQLIALHPVEQIKIHSPSDVAVMYLYNSSILRRNKANRSHRMIYTVRSPRFGKNYGARSIFRYEYMSGASREELNSRYLALPTRGMEQIEQLAADLTGAKVDPATGLTDPSQHAEYARKLVDHLKNSGQYTYSLKSDIFDPDIDPVADFLFNRKYGHCAYYASSLALMLRASDVPARLIIGYKGGDLDLETGAWMVQQRHAHNWVEAYYDREWHTLDATPFAEREAIVSQVAKTTWSWAALKDSLQSFWTQNVVGLSFSEQQRKVYRVSPGEVKVFFLELGRSLDRFLRELIQIVRSPSRLFSVQGAIVVFVFMLMMAAIVFIARKAKRFFQRLFGERRKHANRRRQVEFYERFLALCERRHLVKQPTQTPREFAGQVTKAWNGLLSAAGFAGLPSNIVEKFYGIRFGEQILPSDEQKQLMQTLAQLEQALQPAVSR
jgi:hypothetical protein